MKQYNIIKSILSDPWAIQEEAAYFLSPMVSGLFNPNLEFKVEKHIEPSSIHFFVGARRGQSATAQTGSDSTDQTKTISVIRINGTLTKENQDCGPAGTATIGNWIKQADNDRSIDGILLVIDSPGGSVNGTEELGNIIKNTTKPTIGFVDDQACSAAYWLASCCNEIIANNTTADVGCIGVLMSFMDMQPYYESLGIKFHTITAPQSTDKTKLFDDVRAGKYDEYKNTVLKPLAAKFIDTVKANRPAATDEKLFTGKVFHAQDVVGTLIDSIGTIDQALQRTADLASEKSINTSANNSATTNPPTIEMKDLKLFAKAAKLEAITANADGTVTISAEAAEAVEAAMETNVTAVADTTSKLATATTRITELEAQVAELGAEAGAESAAVTKETDATETANSGDTFWNRFSALKEYNKR